MCAIQRFVECNPVNRDRGVVGLVEEAPAYANSVG